MWTSILRMCLFAAMALLQGCLSPRERLDFPAPMARAADELAFDTSGDGAADFWLRGENGRLDVLCYDDDQDGVEDRVHRLSEHAPENVPHLIVLLDSIPFEGMLERWKRDGWTWIDSPQKVIPPFPTMSGVIFTRMMHAPLTGGMINHYYDRAGQRGRNTLWSRARGEMNGWEKRLHYRLRYWENGLAFLRPRAWFEAELSRAARAFDASEDRVTIVYFASTSGMVSAHGRDGVEEVLNGVERLCVRVLHARRGAVKISIASDHGHNFVNGKRFDVAKALKGGGHTPAKSLRKETDVVVELDGLVNYAGIHTNRPAAVAKTLRECPEIDVVMYMDDGRVLVARGEQLAAVEREGGRVRYMALRGDPLGYEPVALEMRTAGTMDAEGFASDADWLRATADHQWPDAPVRVWEAFHGLAVNTPDVMVTTTPGWYVGLSSMERWVDMASTHGGLDQADSATFVMTMTGRVKGPLRTGEVIPGIEPSYDASYEPKRWRP